MNYQPELLALLVIAIVGQGTFAVFEIETSRWRKVVKWGVVVAATLLARRAIGHAAIAIPVVLALAGTGFHFWWCRQHGIHPLHATPRRRYYELRGWRWVE